MELSISPPCILGECEQVYFKDQYFKITDVSDCLGEEKISTIEPILTRLYNNYFNIPQTPDSGCFIYMKDFNIMIFGGMFFSEFQLAEIFSDCPTIWSFTKKLFKRYPHGYPIRDNHYVSYTNTLDIHVNLLSRGYPIINV